MSSQSMRAAVFNAAQNMSLNTGYVAAFFPNGWDE